MISSHIEETGFPPTRAEICEALGFKSPNAAEEHLKALVKKGAISMVPGASRSIRLYKGKNSKTEDHSLLPLIGRVSAGSPILAEEHIEAQYSVDQKLFAMKPDYLLKVRGMSMKDIGIFEDDLLIVKKLSENHSEKLNGKIIVARIEDEVTVKRFYKRNNLVFLKPENKLFSTIEINVKKQHLVIEGLGIGVIRNPKLGL
tara:strand:- start:13113 stop:13715 length:603 start_codon:yes stop_codon:yes gene_type:complete